MCDARVIPIPILDPGEIDILLAFANILGFHVLQHFGDVLLQVSDRCTKMNINCTFC